MDTIALYVGYGVIFIVTAIITVLILNAIIDFQYSRKMHWVFKLFGFGFVGVSTGNSLILSKMRDLRNDKDAGFSTKNQVIFFNAPTWFNKHVYNTGVVAKK